MIADGNFLFNMDSARDFVDVREMVELKKLRLTGPTTPIDGLYDGPFWYYFLAIGYVILKGDPYSAVLLQIILWAIGGFFLLKLVKNINIFLTIPIGFVWVASNYIVLANLYSFNPTPVTLLAPLFIYSLVEYLENGKAIYGMLTWILAGLFFNFEMNFGVFTPLIIFLSVVLTNNLKLLRKKWFWLGVGLFIATLLPQVIFDLRHQFIMSKAIFKHLSENSGSNINLLVRFQSVSISFYNTFVPTLMNQKWLVWLILGLFVAVLIGFLKTRKKEILIIVSLTFITIPFVGYLFLPVAINPWHLGPEMATSLILIAYLLKRLLEGTFPSKIVSVILSVSIIWFAILNIGNSFIHDRRKPNLDPSLFRNEIAAIDYVYQKAGGQNFKVYTYLPSVYDYPYQYLFWWYGKKKYGYIPGEYAYSPNKPQYISNKEKFEGSKDNYSGLVFLIKEPDRIRMRQAWENDYKGMKFIAKEMVGSIEIEIRKELF